MTPSDNLLRRLARVSPTTAFIVALAVLLAGLFLPGIIGAALLFLLGAGLAALTFTTWPVQKPGDPCRPGDPARSPVRGGRRRRRL